MVIGDGVVVVSLSKVRTVGGDVASVLGVAVLCDGPEGGCEDSCVECELDGCKLGWLD